MYKVVGEKMQVSTWDARSYKKVLSNAEFSIQRSEGGKGGCKQQEVTSRGTVKNL
jgi:hypothetical protein